MSLSSFANTALEVLRIAIAQRTCAANPESVVRLTSHCDMQVWYDGNSQIEDRTRSSWRFKDWETATPAGYDEGEIQTRILHAEGSFVICGPDIGSYVGGTYSAKVCLFRKIGGGRFGSWPWQLLYVTYAMPSHGMSDRPQADFFLGTAFEDWHVLDRLMDPDDAYSLGDFPGVHFPVECRAVLGPSESMPLLRFLAISQGEPWNHDPKPEPAMSVTTVTPITEKPRSWFAWLNPRTWTIFRKVA